MRLSLFLLCFLISATALGQPWQRVVISEFGGIDTLQVVTEQTLPQPAAGEVRVRVLTASASFTDIMVRKGLYPGVTSEPPFPPGYDMVGVVDALGPGVEGLTPGDRVADMTISGAYSEYMLLPADNLVPVPDGLDDQEAVALILSYVTAYQMLHRVARVQPGQHVLIHGASGAVGTAMAQLGRVSGLTMYGTASAGKHDYLRSQGVIPIDYRSEDFVTRIEELTDGRGVDAAFDAISADNFARSYESLSDDGHLVTYGFYSASLAGDSMLDTGLEFLQWRWQNFRWTHWPEAQKRAEFYSIQDYRAAEPMHFKDDLSALFELLAEDNLQPTIYRTLPLVQAAEAHRLIESGEVRGKIVLRVSD